MRLAFAIPWRDRGKWLWEYLPPGWEGDLLFAAPEPESFWEKHRLPPYLGEWFHLATRRVEWNTYDTIFAWELRSALAVALLRRFAGKHRSCFIPVGPILKGGILKALPLVRWLLSDAEQIVCFSSVECETNSQLLKMPREKFVFLPTPWLSDETPTDEDNGFILALGQSNRDYGTLIKAARGTDLPIVIVAGNASALGGEELPANVTVRYNTGHDETNELIASATFHCIPLHPVDFSSGQTVLLRAMSRGKAVIVSDTPGVRDYVQNSETAVLVPPEDAESLRAALLRLWNETTERKRIGGNAAKAVQEEFGFPRFTERLLELVQE